MRFKREPTRDLERFFGALEIRVLEALWARPDGQTVKELLPQFSGIAYTTLMTTLDRLHRKGILAREKVGRAYVYRPRETREELLKGLAGDALEAVFGPRARGIKPILSFFVDTVSGEDRESLAALERLVDERRRVAREEPS